MDNHIHPDSNLKHYPKIEGKLKTLKRFKDEVKDVQSGQDCCMAFEAYDDIKKMM